MNQIVKRLAAFAFFAFIANGMAFGQGNNTGTNETKDKFSAEVITELRLTRLAIQQLQRDLKEFQVAAIRIRLQQEVVTSKEGRLDSLKSETQVTQDALNQVRERLKKLESNDTSILEEGDQQRIRAEIEDAKKEIEREQQRLDTLRLQDSLLTAELLTERARLSEMIAALEAMGPDRISQKTENQLNYGAPNGPPNN